MLQKEGIFGRARPQQDPEIAATLAFRDAERKRFEREPDLEFPPSPAEVSTYLRQRHIEAPFDSLEAEQALIRDLEFAELKYDEDGAKKIRALIWSRSNNVSHSDEVAMAEIKKTLMEKATEIRHAEVETRGESESDILERMTMREEQAEEMEHIAKALEMGVTGLELETGMKEIEFLYSHLLHELLSHYHRKRRKQVSLELNRIRPVRDRLYHDYLFPVLAETKRRSEKNRARERSRGMKSSYQAAAE